ncbi:hypothetical protein GALMADRAFT_54429 [Galerina marginata CBS 339.88]|uniref:NAD(P)-binding domain-containing protein n=1 Tax=Galerina marginata (strain CBS 339.88) TaxID=685588 RepID=A0A067TWP6_GALM3|nr:hypothetical protein GALMADRAFT_54429 [Galerina marginata CBS 339.88]
MQFLILGGTGPSGILLIRNALSSPAYPESSVVVYARTPSKLPADLTNHPRLSIIQGTLEDLDTAETAVQGADVVLSALGPPVTVGAVRYPAGCPIATFYEKLVGMMRRHGVRRFVLLGTASIEDERDRFSLAFKGMVAGVRVGAPNAYKDVVAMGEVVRASGGGEGEWDLDWTIVRVPFLTSGDSEGVVAGYIGDGRTGVRLARKAFAAFVLGEVEKREWVRKAPLISDA